MKHNIFIIYPAFSFFIKADISILNKIFNVIEIKYLTSKKIMSNLVSQINLFISIIKNFKNTAFFYIWFADYHSFLPVFLAKILKKKSILILGGYDVTYIPELNYGSYSNPVRKLCTSFSIKYANYVLAVESSLIDEAKSRVKKTYGKFLYVPTGFDPQKWTCNQKKENLIMTVGICNSMQRLKLKGLDLFIEIANLLPEYNFLIIGMNSKFLKLLEIPSNLKTRDYVSFKELLNYYSRAKVYAQLSLREGFPSVVCEAMLCECIPLGTRINGIITAIGNTGYILKNRDAKGGADLIRKAINSPRELGKMARERIQTNFSIERREKSLYALLENMV